MSRALLCHTSEYFKKALRGDWLEAKASQVAVNDCDPEVLELFLYFLAEKALPDQRSPWYRAHGLYYQFALCDLWIFADIRVAPTLQNRITRDLLSVLGSCIGPHIVQLLEVAYHHNPNSLLSKVLRDQLLTFIVEYDYLKGDSLHQGLMAIESIEGKASTWDDLEARAVQIRDDEIVYMPPSERFKKSLNIAEYMA